MHDIILYVELHTDSNITRTSLLQCVPLNREIMDHTNVMVVSHMQQCVVITQSINSNTSHAVLPTPIRHAIDP